MDEKTCTKCNGCEHGAPETIPYIVYESATARTERTMRKMWAIIILLIVLLVGSNCAWMWYESHFEDITTATYDADSTKMSRDNFSEKDIQDMAAALGCEVNIEFKLPDGTVI